MMTLSTIKVALKYLWILLLIGFVGSYAYQQSDTIQTGLNKIPFNQLAFACLAIVCAKCCLVLHMQCSAFRFSIQLGRRESFYLYNVTQLAKYIPGTIWQFVGRVTYLKSKHVSNASIRSALIFEHGWVIAIALTLGLFVFFSGPNIASIWFSHQQIIHALTVVSIVAFILVFCAVFYWLRTKRIINHREFYPSVSNIIYLVLAWISLGLAFWFTVIPFDQGNVAFLYILGAYCLAYVIGFLVPFAPAGLGVRESLLVLALVALKLTADEALLLASLNRVLYLFVEVILGLFSLWLYKARKQS